MFHANLHPYGKDSSRGKRAYLTRIEPKEKSVRLAAGDTLVLYTDGITEAQTEAGENYEESRLSACLGAPIGAAPADVLEAVMASVRAFEAGAQQADDITCVALTVGAPRIAAPAGESPQTGA